MIMVGRILVFLLSMIHCKSFTCTFYSIKKIYTVSIDLNGLQVLYQFTLFIDLQLNYDWDKRLNSFCFAFAMTIIFQYFSLKKYLCERDDVSGTCRTSCFLCMTETGYQEPHANCRVDLHVTLIDIWSKSSK